jgi:hypothetical protein
VVVVTFLPTPLVRNLVTAIAPDVFVYYCIDPIAETSSGAARVTPSEQQMFGERFLR